jgi:hypothetical protein
MHDIYHNRFASRRFSCGESPNYFDGAQRRRLIRIREKLAQVFPGPADD